MSTRLVVHVGDPKTGTSSIQRALLGGLWSAPGLTVMPRQRLNDYPLANALRRSSETGDPERRWSAFAQHVERSDADLAFISSEQFWNVRPELLLRTIQSHLPACTETASIIAYARPHAARLLSGWVQRCKSGRTRLTLAEHFEEAAFGPNMAYATRFGDWATTFGDRFTLRACDRAVLTGGDVVLDFLTVAAQGRSVELSKQVIQNETLTIPALAALARLQERLHGAGIDQMISIALAGEMTGLMAASAGPRPYMHKALAERAAAVFRDDARRLDARFFADDLFSRRLDSAADNCPDTPFDPAAEAWFEPASLARLDDIAQAIVARLQSDPMLWRRHALRKKGQSPARPDWRERLRLLRHRPKRIDRLLRVYADAVRSEI